MIKKEKIDELLDILNDHISNKIYDATANSGDSYAGLSTYDSEQKLKKALYDILGIK